MSNNLRFEHLSTYHFGVKNYRKKSQALLGLGVEEGFMWGFLFSGGTWNLLPHYDT